MSRTPEVWERRIEARWESAAGRHACRAPLWEAPGAPPHFFLGRRHAGAGSAEREAAEVSDVARRTLGGGLRAARLRQEHGVALRRVRAGDADLSPAGDGLSTDDPDLALGVQSADCLPILLADRRRGAVAAVHAGWRGSAAGIVLRALEHLAAEYGSAAADLDAVLGPAVGGCCYEVGDDVRQAVARGPLAPLADFDPGGCGRLRLDLARLNAAALLQAGVAPGRVQIVAACTRCSVERLHSYRAEGSQAGRNWSLIAAPRVR